MLTYQRQILCAEGHDDTREFLIIWLGRAGFEVTPCDTIAECAEMAASRRFHLYLIGDRFLDGSGFDLVEKIRSFDGHTPLVINSTLAYPTDIERGMKAGAQAYITRPSDPKHLVETINLLIDTDDRKGRSVTTVAVSA
ncbi:MAG: response regulator [Acidobacteriota bacterium]